MSSVGPVPSVRPPTNVSSISTRSYGLTLLEQRPGSNILDGVRRTLCESFIVAARVSGLEVHAATWGSSIRVSV
jgi:hypothetical protein